MARSRTRPSIWSFVRTDRACLGRSGGFAPVSFPLFHGTPWAVVTWSSMASLTLQPPARLDSVEIAVDVKLEHRRRMIRGPAGRCRIDAIETEVAEFQRIDKNIDRANRIALVDPIIKAFRQQRRLLAIRPLNETLHHPPAIQ